MSAEAAAFAGELTRRLDALVESGREVRLWWRDDDATADTPALRRLLDLAGGHDVPLCLAVIPRDAEEGLARVVREAPGVWVSQHGWAHEDHETPPDKAAELGDARPVGTVLAELSEGHEKLRRLFGEAFRPVLTPPWNRISETVAARRREAGLPGLSTFAARHADDPLCRNTHLDPIAWKRGRRFVGYGRMLHLVGEAIEIHGSSAIGLLTHHLAHDEDVWDFTGAFVAATAKHPAVRWVGPGDLFPGL